MSIVCRAGPRATFLGDSLGPSSQGLTQSSLHVRRATRGAAAGGSNLQGASDSRVSRTAGTTGTGGGHWNLAAAPRHLLLIF